ncbi:CD177 antigen [Hemicordylus capensis]|uniref:CD177 antigen n=1 Tax=Hemicordylus capensis TaxID=884348 RepID=UPI0023048647|nr:CD177 antigen [Hemicordylus capensis]
MERTTSRWSSRTAVVLGFLAMILFISGTSAVKCHDSRTVLKYGSKGQLSMNVSMFQEFSNCSQNVCMEETVMLRTDRNVILAIYRGCAGQDLNDTGAASFDDQHFIIQSNASYCSEDLCNKEITVLGDLPETPGQDKASEASGSNQCYSGLASTSSNVFRERVTCRKGYSQCYDGGGYISIGPQVSLSSRLFIKTCQRPVCAVPQNLSFGAIRIQLWGSCCLGSNCNGNTTAPEILSQCCSNDNIRSPDSTKSDSEGGAGISPMVPGDSGVTDSNTTRLLPPEAVDYEDIGKEIFLPPWKPIEGHWVMASGSRLPNLQYWLLLLALGRTVLEIS